MYTFSIVRVLAYVTVRGGLGKRKGGGSLIGWERELRGERRSKGEEGGGRRGAGGVREDNNLEK